MLRRAAAFIVPARLTTLFVFPFQAAADRSAALSTEQARSEQLQAWMKKMKGSFAGFTLISAEQLMREHGIEDEAGADAAATAAAAPGAGASGAAGASSGAAAATPVKGAEESKKQDGVAAGKSGSAAAGADASAGAGAGKDAQSKLWSSSLPALAKGGAAASPAAKGMFFF